MPSNKNIPFTIFHVIIYLPVVQLLCKGLSKYDIIVAKLTLESTDNLVPIQYATNTILGRATGR